MLSLNILTSTVYKKMEDEKERIKSERRFVEEERKKVSETITKMQNMAAMFEVTL